MPDLGMLLAQASHVLNTELTARLDAALGITPRAHCVLQHALEADRTQRELAELCALDKTTMVVTLDQLERAGLAQRRLSASDRRARIVAVTPEGRRLVARSRAIVDEVQTDVLATLPEAVRDSFMTGLCQLAGDRLSTPVACEIPVRRRVPRAPSAQK
jgi:MarR family transcriptional regulator for hemolysin